ncbi:hypothetical protein [Cecembia calidifontis]|uniref:Uncharacterized protein n=1 Tax=Cecembia calidifontis TaxID=1187080 RepID=A0A4V2F6B2_9BACT|nr:hypothetical protein [Cecembia calidifontis]RZS95709.1 hypothetical protein BC751_1249 [Cecembia calidifontis]
MKLYVKGFFLVMLILISCEGGSKYDPGKYLNEKEQKQILLTSIRYMGHLPKKATHQTKFDPVYDEYYSKLALDYTLEAYYKKDGYEYFLASRIAPSLKVKKVAIGVKMKRTSDGQLEFYEEVFRTWKFEIPEMLEKGLMLFDKMVKGEDLSPYYPQNSGEEEYIEFPDAKVYFDVEERRWKINSIHQPDLEEII